MKNDISSSLKLLNETERSAYEASRGGGIAPLAKLAAVLYFIIITASFDRYALSGLVPMLLIPAVSFQLCDISLRHFLFRFRFVMPFVIFAGVLNPVFDREILFYIGDIGVSGGVVSMLTLILKGILCLMAACLLSETTTVDSLCAGLRRLHVSSYILTLFLLTWRYLEVIGGEAASMTDAYRLRAPGQRGIDIKAWGSFTGQLLLRSIDRAEDIYDSMRLRGFDGEFFYADTQKWSLKDTVFLILTAAVFTALRALPAARLLGGLFIG